MLAAKHNCECARQSCQHVSHALRPSSLPFVQAPKRRKAVDRRASKGRKLRFHVHDKLVNFMAPASDSHGGGSGDGGGVGPALFTNLFGQRQQPAAAAQLA